MIKMIATYLNSSQSVTELSDQKLTIDVRVNIMMGAKWYVP